MALDLPTSSNEVALRTKTDIQRSLEESNPFLKNSYLGALAIGMSGRNFDFYLQLEEAIRLSFPDTTEGEFLDRWAAILGIVRSAATQSSGNVVARGTVGVNIPISTNYQSSDGLVYISTAAATLTAQSISVSSIIRVGTLVTVTTTDNHGLASNIAVTISGASQIDYNGVQEIIVTAANVFEYQIATTPITPATGTILADFTSATVPLQSIDFETIDQTVNQTLDATLTLSSPIAGVADTANVDFGAIGGGIVQESDSDLTIRFLDKFQNPVAHFSVADIEAQAKLVPGVTRVFVDSITPAIGQVTVYFMRDNDDNAIPDSSEVTTVKNKLLEILPANTASTDLIVNAPTAVPVNFIFTTLEPNTTSMQEEILLSLGQLFDETVSVGEDVDENDYTCAIWNTVDDQGNSVTDFDLSSPTGDISIAAGQIATLGTVVFP